MKSLLFALLLSLAAQAAEPPMLLWPNGAPGALGARPEDRPTLTAYLTGAEMGPAMLLIPGGSYSGIYEGQAEPFAQWLNAQGISAFVLRYRLGSAGYRYPAQLQDAVEAMYQIRGGAANWKLDPKRIGVMGFSAGGHLVSTLINRPGDGQIVGQDRTCSARPDLVILCYPVISMITKPHPTSRQMLVGEKPTADVLKLTSSELQVRPGLPPCFLWHTMEDKLVPVEHAQLYAAALHRNAVPHEVHFYQHGDHGTGLIGTTHPWFEDLRHWLKAQGFIPAAP